MAFVVAETLEVPGGLYRTALCILDATRHDKGVARVLLEELVRLHVQRVGGDVPDDLVDPDPAPGRLPAVPSAAQGDEQNGLARDASDVYWPAERNRQPRLEVEAVQGIEKGYVFA